MLIQRKFSLNRSKISRRIYIISSAWVIGLFLGIVLAYTFSGFAPQISSAVFAQAVKPTPALLSLIFPVVACAVSIWCGTPSLCYPVILCEGTCRGFCSMLLYYAAPEAAWLYRLLFLFSASISSVCTWLIVIRHAKNHDTSLGTDTYIALIIICAALIFDIHFLSPFLDELTKYL